MAQPTTPNTTGPSVEDSFVTDRMTFWNRFTSFTKGSVIALVVLLLAMLIFLW